MDDRNAEGSGTPPEGVPVRKRDRRRLSRVGLVVAGLLVLAVVAVWLVAENVEQPWVKARLVALIRHQSGLELDYTGLELSLTRGVRARELRVLSPPRFAEHAPTFLRVHDLELEIGLWALVSRREIAALRAARVEIDVVRDASGTTLTELRPARPFGPPLPDAASGRPSRLLSELPRVRLKRLDIRAIEARLIELRTDGPRRDVTVSGLELSGLLQSGARGLEGSEVVLSGAPVLLEVLDGLRRWRAELPGELRLRAADAKSVALDGRVNVGEQDAVPGWAAPRQLLELEGSAHFEPRAGKTTIELARLGALDGAVASELRADMYDAEGLQVVASGRTTVRLARVPLGPWGWGLDSLELDAALEEASWDRSRVGGSIALSGRLRGVELALRENHARLSTVALFAEGTFGGVEDRFGGSLTVAAVDVRTPERALAVGPLVAELHGTASERAGARQIDARAVLELASAQASAPGGAVVELERASATADVDELIFDTAAPFGARGAAGLSLSLPSLRLLDAAARVRRGSGRHPSASLGGLQVSAQLPLSLERAAGTLSIAELTEGRHAARDLTLGFELHEPLAWRTGSAGTPQATARGRLGSFELNDSRGALEDLSLFAQRLERERYVVELGASAAAIGADRRALPGRVAVEVGADAALATGALRVTAAVRGDEAAALDFDLDAGFDRSSERLRYRAELSGENLGALAAFVSALEPGAAPVALGKLSVQASASGDLRGVLRAKAGLLPEPSQRPWVTARGSQVVQVHIEGVDYRGPSGVVVIPELSVELGSLHGAGGGGHLNGSVRAGALRFEGGGNALRLRGLTQRLEASYERPPEEGTLEVRSTLELASAEQSWLPAYSMRDVHASGQIDIERLRAIFLRELRLDNPVAGTELRAEGALELRPRGAADPDTLIGRQALALSGRLEQDLAPLQEMGLAERAGGSLAVPFRIESGGLLAYRVLADLEAHDVSWTTPERSVAIEGLIGTIPIEQELVVLPEGLAIGPKPRTSPLADVRFFDVHPFLGDRGYVACRSIRLGGSELLGPLAANVRVERSDFLVDQLQAGLRGGQIVGRLGMAYGDNDPTLRLHLNATGLRSNESGDVFDANLALIFVPRAMTLDGKVQVVRASRAHVLEILDKLDPFHESVNANRVRGALAFGYPKYVRFDLHDGVVDTKVDLGGLAAAARIGDIKAVPLGPMLERYVAPALSGFLLRGAQPPVTEEAAREVGSPEARMDSRKRARRDAQEVRP